MPANASVRTPVLFSESLNNRSTMGRVPSVNTTGLVNRSTIRAESCPARQIYCRANRRNKSQPSMMNRTFGNQTSSSGCACGFPRSVSPMMTKRK
jgi:hypothetical protein